MAKLVCCLASGPQEERVFHVARKNLPMRYGLSEKLSREQAFAY